MASIFAYVSNPGSYEDVVNMLILVFQERQLMWDDYTVPGGTFRENMRWTPGESLLPDTHSAAQFRYNALKKAGKINAEGHVVIDKVKEAEDKQLANGNGLKRKVCS